MTWSTKLVSVRNVFASAIMLASAVALTASEATAATPCPEGSADRWFTYELDGPLCTLGAVEGHPPEVTMGRFYNVYCPGRMTDADAKKVAQGLVSTQSDRLILKEQRQPDGTIARNAIHAHYYAAYRLTPAIEGRSKPIRHLFHYTCTRDGKQGVATHLKIHTVANPTPQEVAKRARLTSHAGAFQVGKKVTREYQLPVQIKTWEQPEYPKPDHYYVAAWLVHNDAAALADLHRVGGRACIRRWNTMYGPTDGTRVGWNYSLRNTTQTSNRLVVDIDIVEKSRSCPPNAAWGPDRAQLWVEGARVTRPDGSVVIAPLTSHKPLPNSRY